MGTTITKRVPAQGAVAGTPFALGNDSWGGTWGAVWGNGWYFATAEGSPTAASPAIDVTKRVAAASAGGQTSRLPPPFLALEGDESGFLLLEGDAQSGDDIIKLEGSEALIVATNVTKRVASTVT